MRLKYPVATYLSLLQSQENEMVELLSQDFEDEWRYPEAKNPVALTWLISFHQIQRLNSLAADIYHSCLVLILGISPSHFFHRIVHRSSNKMHWAF